MSTSYHHHSNIHRRMKRWERAHKFLILGLFLLIIFIVAGAVYLWQQNIVKQSPQQSQSTSLGAYIGNPKKTISNEIFSFESAKNWQISQENSTLPTRYVFFSQKNGLIDYELTIAFDNSLQTKPANYVTAVMLDLNKLKVVGISPRCTDSVPKIGIITRAAVFKGAKYVCETQGSKELYMASMVGGTYSITLKNSKGKPVVVNFMFEDHSQGHYPDAFIEVLEGFRLK